VWGGCWCTWFHPRDDKLETDDSRTFKERLVRAGKAHAALIFDGDAAVAWYQYGPPSELPRIYHRKEYEAGRTEEPPDYRVTCFFVDRDYRKSGVAAAALRGAPDLIAKAGGGVVEGYPQDTQGKEGFSLVPLQRHAQHVRGGRLQLRAAQSEEHLRHAQGGLAHRSVSQKRRLLIRSPGRRV
jgi:hypothetical protein